MSKSNLLDLSVTANSELSSPLIPMPSQVDKNLKEDENMNPSSRCTPMKCNTNVSKQPFFLMRESITPLSNRKDLLNVNNRDSLESNNSLQILNDSFIFHNQYSVAVKTPLPNSPEEVFSFNNIEHIENPNVPMISINIKDTPITDNGSLLNRAFLKTLSSESSKDSFECCSTFRNSVDVSTIYTISNNTLNTAFRKSSEFTSDRHCMTPKYQAKSESVLMNVPFSGFSRVNFNNSFAGYNLMERESQNDKLNGSYISNGYQNDSVFLESHLEYTFRKMSLKCNNTDYLENSLPPWLEDEDNSIEKEIANVDKELTICTENNQSEHNICDKFVNIDEIRSMKTRCSSLETLSSDVSDLDNSKCLEMGNFSKEVSQMNMFTNTEKETYSDPYSFPFNYSSSTELLDLRVNKSFDSSEALDLSISSGTTIKSTKSLEVQKSLSRMQMPCSQFSVTLNVDKKLKPSIDKSASKGPLKAVIPVKDMTKNKKNISLQNLLNAKTPSKSVDRCSMVQIKRTSTPNERKLKPPIAQSTPDVTSKIKTTTGTPLMKYFVSPLVKRKSLDSSILNKSSPCSVKKTQPIKKHTSSKELMNTSIPVVCNSNNMCRRKSAGDLKFNSSVKVSDINKTTKARIELKRSTSFQSKISSSKGSNSNKSLITNFSYKK